MSDARDTTARPSAGAASPPGHRTRPFYWSVRREIWEHRFIYLAPLAIAALVLFSYTVGTLHLPHIMASQSATEKTPAHMPPTGLPYSIAAVSVILTGILVGVFYCLGALYNERRDRSILFWKSLPVPDVIAVLAKASIPLIVLPVIVFTVTISMQLLMSGLTALIVLTHGESLPAFWVTWPIYRMALVLAYGLVTLALWHAPVYAWLLMVSAWARRAPFLWAVLPPIALCLAEKIAFDSSVLGGMLDNRLFGSFNAAFNAQGPSAGTLIDISQIAPLQFLETADLWIGLGVTIVFLAAAVRLRRTRGSL
jgi:ABC-2 type transport system permease protein